MKVVAIIEKGKDGMYAIRTEQIISSVCPGGFGESVAEAKEDFVECIGEALDEMPSDSRIDINEVDVEYHYDMPSFFNYFDWINASRLAEHIGINKSQMRQYKSGLAYPNEKTTLKILNEIKAIGQELSASSL